MVVLRELKTNKDVKLFGTYKLEMIKYHQQYANKLGLQDRVVDEYSYEDAIKHIVKSSYHQFLIVDDACPVGMLEYQLSTSDIDGMPILYVKGIYIEELSRGKGLGRAAINELRRIGYRIELECWYGMPANDVYKALGAKEIKTRYIL